MSFDTIRDHTTPLRLLGRMLETGRIPHGLLFWGPDGVGKRLTAFEMAKAVNCTGDGPVPCDTCLSCRRVASGNHPDLKVVTPVGRARVIKVENIEEVNEFAALRAFESRRRVFIFLEAERMNAPAQNHFLKTLEEPPGQSLFILVTAFPRILLPTIRSRCQQVRFGALRQETVAELLQVQRDLPQDTATALAALSQGQMSRALDLVDSDKREVSLAVAERLADREDPLALAEEFAEHLAARREAIAAAVKAETDENTLAEASPEDKERIKEEQAALVDGLRRRDIMEYLYLFETWYRDLMVCRATGGTDKVLNHDRTERLRADAQQAGDCAAKLAAIEKARLYIERNLNVDRIFRDLFFALAP